MKALQAGAIFCVGAILSFFSQKTLLDSIYCNPLTYYMFLDPILSNFGLIENNPFRNLHLLLMWSSLHGGFALHSYLDYSIYILLFQWSIFCFIFETYSYYSEQEKRQKQKTQFVEHTCQNFSYVQQQQIHPVVNEVKCYPANCFLYRKNEYQKDVPEKTQTQPSTDIKDKLKKYAEKVRSNGDEYTASSIEKYIKILDSSPNKEDIYDQLLDLLVLPRESSDSEEVLMKYLNNFV